MAAQDGGPFSPSVISPEEIRLAPVEVEPPFVPYKAVLPGVIFGVGYIVAFNFPFGMKELALTGTMAILVINILFGNIFVGVLAGRAMLQRIDAYLRGQGDDVRQVSATIGAQWQRGTFTPPAHAPIRSRRSIRTSS